MALPRYQNVGVEVAGGIRGLDFPSRGESTRGFDTISAVLDRMSESFFKEAATAATAEGEKYGAENAPTPEQIAEARKLNQPVAPIGDSRTYFGKAASQAATRIAAKNVAVDAELEMGRIQNDIAAGKVSANDVVPRVNALAKGYSSALKEFDPVMARSVEADLALHGNKMFLAASKKATADAIAAQGAKALEAGEETYRNNVKFIIANGDQLLQGPNVDGNASVYTLQQQIDDAYAKAENQFKSLPKAARKEAMKSLPVWAQAEFKSFAIDKVVKAKSEDELKPILEGLQNGQYDAFFTANKDEALRIKTILTSAIHGFEKQDTRALANERTRYSALSSNIMASIDSGKILDTTVLPTKEQHDKAFANDPARGEVIWSQITTAVETHQAWTEIKYRSFEETTAKRNQLAQEFRDSTLEQSADRKKKLDTFDKAIGLKNQILEKDPAPFAMQLPEVKEAEAKTRKEGMTFEQAVAARENYAEVMKNAQVYLGLPGSAVKILPKQEVDSLVADWEDKSVGGTYAAQWLQEKAALWGAAWPDVMNQLRKELPPTAEVISNMQGIGQSGPAAILAKASIKENQDAQRKLLADDHVLAKNINESLNVTMKPWFESNSLNDKDGLAISEQYKSAVRTLSIEYTRRGISEKDAVKKAYDDVIGSQYTFHGTFRIPRSEKTPDVIAQSANTLLFYLDKYKIDLPPSAMSIQTQKPIEQQRSEYIASIKETGRWINDPDQKGGLILLDGSNSIVTVNNGNESDPSKKIRFQMGWNDLAEPIQKPRPMYTGQQSYTATPKLPLPQWQKVK
jgi:hypothetical protein